MCYGLHPISTPVPPRWRGRAGASSRPPSEDTSCPTTPVMMLITHLSFLKPKGLLKGDWKIGQLLKQVKKNSISFGFDYLSLDTIKVRDRSFG